MKHPALLKGLLYGAALTPLMYVGGLLVPAISTKFFWFSLMMVGLLLAGAAYLIRQKQGSQLIQLTLPDGLLIGLVVMLGVATAFSPDPVASFFSDFERLDGWLMWLLLLVYYLGLVWTVERRDWFAHMVVVVLVGGIVALFSFNQSAYDAGERTTSVIGNAMFLGQYLLLVAGVSVIGYLESRTSITRYTFASAGALSVIGLFLTETRGALIGCIAAVIVGVGVSIVRSVRHVSRFTRMHVVVGLVGALMLALCAVLIGMSGVGERLLATSFTSLDHNPRYFLWEAGIDMVLERPVIGWGFEQYEDQYQRLFESSYFNEDKIANPEIWHDRAHNTYIDIALVGGVPALLLLVALCVVYGRSIVQHVYEEKKTIGVAVVLTAWLASSLFSFPAFNSLIVLIFVLAWWRSQHEWVVWSVQLRPTTRSLVAIVLIVTGIGLFGVTAVRYGDAAHVGAALRTNNESLKRAEALTAVVDDVRLSPDRAFVKNLATDEYAKAAHRLVDQRVENELRELGPKIVETDGGIVSQKQRFTLIEGALRNTDPEFAHVLLASSSPQESVWQPTLLQAIKVYALLRENDQAFALARRTYELEPESGRAVLAYAAALNRLGSTTEAEVVMNDYFGTVMVYDRMYLLSLLNTSPDKVRFVLNEAEEQYEPNLFRKALRILATDVRNRNEVLETYTFASDAERDALESLTNVPHTYQPRTHQILAW